MSSFSRVRDPLSRRDTSVVTHATDFCSDDAATRHSGAIKPIAAKPFPLAEAVDAMRSVVEGRPFGRVVLTI